MKPITYKHGNLTLDDWEENKDNVHVFYCWTQLCSDHAKQITQPNSLDDCGSGICGVEGCWEESEYYLDFDYEDINGVEHNYVELINQTKGNL